jgi:hypothetical protein
VDGAIVNSSSNEEDEEEDNNDPILVMDREQYGHTGNVTKRKQQPGERDDWAHLQAPGHTVGVPRTSSQPTGQYSIGGGASVPTGHTVGRDAALSDHHLDSIVQVRGMPKTESMRNQQKHVVDRVRAFVKASV